ncbi:MAG: excinuclease ABC subunit UvrC [Candidatus Auribacter fodinae]|jgi:excinuclease ABC subunit C|uniref:UvrABC system protein C n=1 Tax=Candidatus Auribacter fodinae TaxID=2093366 RepID=A0A3A4R7E4_9BACT|nr:MAG: excinuclease ABC subunit UvrC [Candidatus Auribacter fodinae]
MTEFVASQNGITDRFLDTIPSQPGVYIMKDSEGAVLYVGKSRNLRSRVRQYFRKSGDTRYSIKFIQRYVKNIEFCLTETEKEALILENNLIKKMTPRYNVRLRDDKTFLHIRININEDFPALQLIRRPRNDKALYLGPYSSSRQIKEAIRHLQMLYPLRMCKDNVFRTRTRPCLNCQIRKCLGPCCGGVSREDYHAMLDEVIMILRGQKSTIIEKLKKDMEAASEAMEYEKAAHLRDKVLALEQSLERQDIVSNKWVNKDIIAMVYHDRSVSIHVLTVRNGRLEGSDNFIVPHHDLPEQDIQDSFIEQFYSDRHVPDTVVVESCGEDTDVLQDWLSEKAGRKIQVCAAGRGDNLRLLKMAQKSASQNLLVKKNTENDLSLLKKTFHLINIPRTMECYDISNFQGDAAVGAQVVFVDCKPAKKLYRRYSIKTVEGQNDFAMMAEVMSRRLCRAVEDRQFPDLCIIDGGKGQLAAAYACYTERKDKLPHIDFIALAKDRDGTEESAGEKVFLPNRRNPIYLKPNSEPAKLLDRIRDETHRFAITYHRKKMKKKRLTSEITGIPGLGKEREKLLRMYFGSLKSLKSATLEQLLLVNGIGPKLARSIYEYYHPEAR